MIEGIYNVKNFGAKGDGETDNTPAFEAAMAAMGPVTTGQARHGTLFVPPGDYWFKSDLKIERAIKLLGTGPGSAWSKSRLVFAPYKGLRVYTFGPHFGAGAHATIEDIDIICGHPPRTPLSAPDHAVWTPLHPYEKGDRILPAKTRAVTKIALSEARYASFNNYDPGFTWEYHYECIRGGTSGGEEPDWTLAQDIDQSEDWKPNTDYYYYSLARQPGRFDVYFTPARPNYDNTYPGRPGEDGGAHRSGAALPNFAGAQPGDVVIESLPDGTPNIIWHCCSTGSEPPLRRGGRRYVPNRGVMRSAARTDVVFVLEDNGVVPGVGYFQTDAAEPPEFATAIPGNLDVPGDGELVIETGPDGPLKWRCKRDNSLWQQAFTYQKGGVVRPKSRYDILFRLEQVTGGTTPVTGTSGAAEPPGFAVAKPGDLVEEKIVRVDGSTTTTTTLSWRCHSASTYFEGDGCSLSPVAAEDGPVWACRVAAGIYTQARVTVNRVMVQHALNAGLHAQASLRDFLPPSNANGFSVYDFKAYQCGCGIVTRGGDCNASVVVNADISLFGFDPKYDKAVGIAERSFLGNRYFACQVAECGGPAYLVPSRSNTGGLYGCYSENTGPSEIVPAGFLVFGGSYGSGFDTYGSGWVLDNRFSVPRFNVVNNRAVAPLETYVGYDDEKSVLGWRANGASAYWLLWWDTANKIWRLQQGAAAPAGSPASYFTDIGYRRADAVMGLQGFPSLLLGDPDTAVKISRGGKPVNSGEPGDIVFNSDPKLGGFIGWVYVGAEREWRPFGKIE